MTRYKAVIHLSDWIRIHYERPSIGALYGALNQKHIDMAQKIMIEKWEGRTCVTAWDMTKHLQYGVAA